MSDRFKIVHKTQGWIALLTWSQERAEKWLAEFDARIYTDKKLRAEDFEIIDTKSTKKDGQQNGNESTV